MSEISPNIYGSKMLLEFESTKISLEYKEQSKLIQIQWFKMHYFIWTILAIIFYSVYLSSEQIESAEKIKFGILVGFLCFTPIHSYFLLKYSNSFCTEIILSLVSLFYLLVFIDFNFILLEKNESSQIQVIFFGVFLQYLLSNEGKLQIHWIFLLLKSIIVLIFLACKYSFIQNDKIHSNEIEALTINIIVLICVQAYDNYFAENDRKFF